MVRFSASLAVLTIAALVIGTVFGAPQKPKDLEDKQQRFCQPGWTYNGWDCAHAPCGIGHYWNGYGCTDNSGRPGCPPDFYWNSVECVRTGGGHNCAPRHFWNGDTCILDLGSHPCLLRYYWDGYTCRLIVNQDFVWADFGDKN